MTKFFRLFLLLTFTTITFSACTEDPEDSTGNIYGVVFDKITNDPLDGVMVRLIPTGESTNTYADGSFEFLDLQPGDYTLQFSKNGYAQTSHTVEIVAGGNSGASIYMEKANQVAEIVINPSSLNFGTSQTLALIPISEPTRL
ncbi:MAG: carboxypeptidase-like regulatory domain-containing protein, partial [Muribaculum sp.]|nr:carboxypeptidase-like regulatory domain-containing protein [Muribaculum sp.]